LSATSNGSIIYDLAKLWHFSEQHRADQEIDPGC
jgi:hypothetical protein